jgi:hypothetical protein
VQVRKLVSYMGVSREEWGNRLPPFDEMMRRIEENARAFAALPPEEQARIEAEREAAYEAQRCMACGCHPDEHDDR